ncbi:SMC-Scp complex subunit ScpB [Candidatus Woesearchaeota archaeon]|nr:SMC-Scp complex subunit ScpB [Candidatus Woesearchaeota archaeon]
MTDLKIKIEALLFSSGKKVTYEELARLCNSDMESVKKDLANLKKEYDERDSPLMFSEEVDGCKLTVREKYLPIVHSMLPETELSKTLLETLAVVAWKQPALQADVVKIRTNKAYEDVAELVERGFISKEKHGRSYILKTTPKFSEYFDLPGKEAIKKVFEEVIEDAEKGKQLQMEDFEKQKPEMLDHLEVYDTEKVIVEDRKKEAEEEPEEEKEEKEIEKKKEEVLKELGVDEEEEEKEETNSEELKEEVRQDKKEEAEKKEEESKGKEEKETGRELSGELEEFAEEEEEQPEEEEKEE